MIRSLFLFLLLLSTAQVALSQSLTGTVRLNSTQWRPVVYLLKIDRFQTAFNGDSRMVVDSAVVDRRGHFRFGRLKPRTFYRLGMVPAGETNGGTIISDGTHDNHVFLLTDDEVPAVQQVSFSADSMLLSFRFGTISARTAAFTKLFRQRLPVYAVLRKLDSMTEALGGDSAARSRVLPEAIRAINDELALTDKPLAAMLFQTKDPLVFAAGMELYCGFESIDKNPALVDYGRSVLRKSADAYSKSLQSKIAGLSRNAEKRAVLRQAFPMLGGSAMRLDTVSSRLLLLDFWASWCQPCRSDLRRTIIPMAGRFSAADLRIVGVNLDEDSVRTKFVVRADGNPYPQLFSGAAFNDQLARTFSVTSIPAYVVYDTRSGNFYQGLPAVQLAAKMEELLRSNGQ